MPQYKLTTSWLVDTAVAIESVSRHDVYRLVAQLQSRLSSAIRQVTGFLPTMANPITMERWPPPYTPPPAEPERQELEVHLL